MRLSEEKNGQLERLRAFDLTIKLMLVFLLLGSRVLYLYSFPAHIYLALAGTAIIGFIAKVGLFWLISREWIA